MRAAVAALTPLGMAAIALAMLWDRATDARGPRGAARSLAVAAWITALVVYAHTLATVPR